MAHKEQIAWCNSIKERFAGRFSGPIRVVDIGSLDVSSADDSVNNKHLFKIEPPGEYIGLDVVEGKNVDVVSIAHEYEAPDESFDIVCSVNALEHDMYYPRTLKKMCRLLKPGGLMFMSIGAKWVEHGTLKCYPSVSGTSQLDKAWADYYHNLTVREVMSSIDIDDIFAEFQIGISGRDLQFWGVK